MYNVRIMIPRVTRGISIYFQIDLGENHYIPVNTEYKLGYTSVDSNSACVAYVNVPSSQGTHLQARSYGNRVPQVGEVYKFMGYVDNRRIGIQAYIIGWWICSPIRSLVQIKCTINIIFLLLFLLVLFIFIIYKVNIIVPFDHHGIKVKII